MSHMNLDYGVDRARLVPAWKRFISVSTSYQDIFMKVYQDPLRLVARHKPTGIVMEWSLSSYIGSEEAFHKDFLMFMGPTVQGYFEGSEQYSAVLKGLAEFRDREDIDDEPF